MNTDNNHLISDYDQRRLIKELNGEYTLVPDNLQRTAKRKLNGKSESYVSKTSGGKLSKWAAKVRKNNNIDL